MTRHSPRADDYGTALSQALPWLRAIDNLAAAARALGLGTGSKAEVAQRLVEYDAAAKAIEGAEA